MRQAIIILLALAASAAHAITATKEYVDRSTNAVLRAATNYTDSAKASAISSSKTYTDAATNGLLKASVAEATYFPKTGGEIEGSVHVYGGLAIQSSLNMGGDANIAGTTIIDGGLWARGSQGIGIGDEGRPIVYSLTVNGVEKRGDVVLDIPSGGGGLGTNDVNALIATYDETNGVAHSVRDWSSPGAWEITYSIDPTTTIVGEVHLITNADDRVMSNSVVTTTYGNTARCFQSVLDEVSLEIPPVVSWESLTEGGSFVGNVFSATANGIYRVKGTDAKGGSMLTDISIFNNVKREETKSVYAADADGSARKAVNDAAKTAIMAAVARGTGTIGGESYNKYDTFGLPFAPRGKGNYNTWAVSPHVVASAQHYGPRPLGQQTFAWGGASVTVTKERWYHLTEWALTNGWTQAELDAMGIDDIAFCKLSSATAIPSAWCPKFMSSTKRDILFPETMEGVQAWYVGQDSTNAIPVVMLGRNTITYQSCYIHARYDIDAELTARKPWAWPYTGDSGKPIFVMLNGEPVIISAFKTVNGGPCYTDGFAVIKAFVEFCGDTIKEVQ